MCPLAQANGQVQGPVPHRVLGTNERRLNMVLGITQRAAVPTVDDEEYEPVAAPEPSSFRQQMSAPSPVKEEAVVDDDDALSYFARLAEE